MTNADKIRAMSDEDLALVIMCPYDTVGDESRIMPCILSAPRSKDCYKCTLEWLRREHGEGKAD